MSTIDFGCVLAMVVVCVVALTMRLADSAESAELGLSWWQNFVSAAVWIAAAGCGVGMLVAIISFSEVVRTAPPQPSIVPAPEPIKLAFSAFALLGVAFSIAFGLFALRAWVVDSKASAGDSTLIAMWFTVAPSIGIVAILAIIAAIRWCTGGAAVGAGAGDDALRDTADAEGDSDRTETTGSDATASADGGDRR